MRKIVRGNDFVLRIPVVKQVGGEKVEMPLRACTALTVALVSSFKRYQLATELAVDAENVALAKVEGDEMPCGCYALEVRGKLFGSDWRSCEYEQIRLVGNNAEADTEFDVTDEGENSVEIDTQVVVMGASVPAINPRGEWDASAEYKRGDAVSHGLKCWWAENDNTASEPADGNADWVVLVDASGFKDELQGAAEGATEAAAAAAEATEKASAAAEKAEASATTADASAEKANAAAEKAEKAAEGAGGCDCPVESGSGAGSVQSKGYTDDNGNEIKGGDASGQGAVAMGLGSTALGQGDHAEGYGTTASGGSSHAEGSSTTASGEASHAEGQNTGAYGECCHAEGKQTFVEGIACHSEGIGTYAVGQGSHVEGCYNYPSGYGVHIVGIGTSMSREDCKNAEVILYDTSSAKNGYKYLIGIGGYDGTNFSTFDEEGNETLNTEIKSVQEVIAELQESGGGSGSVEAITEDTINALS